ncbi:hypothetical protein NP493_258g02016 [Ridgeia piscesae]|uniref:Neurochondrin n=1 Tax=Ridgeia piscesae TaxID=27915 RepID=A0AAD9NY65_RIDPI|nr:hypothetical protein NP493_258g02016 [Ridgeia piscesae]
MLLTKLATDFQHAQELVEELTHSEWVDDVYTTLLHLLQSRLGQKEREAAIEVSALLVNLLGVEWALEKEGESKTFVLLLIHLVCVEVRMTLEDLNPAQDQPIRRRTDITVSLQIASLGSLLSACYSVLEAMIGHMTSASTLALDQAQVEQVHAAMVGAFNAVLYFLSQCQGQVDDQDTRLTESQMTLYPVVLASVRVLGSWIAEETLAL